MSTPDAVSTAVSDGAVGRAGSAAAGARAGVGTGTEVASAGGSARAKGADSASRASRNDRDNVVIDHLPWRTCVSKLRSRDARGCGYARLALNAHIADCLANVFELVWPDDRGDQFHESDSSPVRCADSPPNVGPYGAAASTRRARKGHSSLIKQLQPEPASFLGSPALSWGGDFLHCSIVWQHELSVGRQALGHGSAPRTSATGRKNRCNPQRVALEGRLANRPPGTSGTRQHRFDAAGDSALLLSQFIEAAMPFAVIVY